MPKESASKWKAAPEDLERFVRALEEEAPPLATIEAVEWRPLSPLGYREFRIEESRAGAARTLVSPDVATCEDCLAEVLDPNDRRYRYPFTNCTNCGPRFTITRQVPYDRATTTMSGFTMCPDCQSEYDNPANRRFHAQPNACNRKKGDGFSAIEYMQADDPAIEKQGMIDMIREMEKRIEST